MEGEGRRGEGDGRWGRNGERRRRGRNVGDEVTGDAARDDDGRMQLVKDGGYFR